MPEKNAKKCNFDKKNPMKLSFSIHVHFVENNNLGGFATTFPSEMKPSNHTFPPPLPKNNNDNNNNRGRKVKKAGMTESQKNKILRWLDRVYQDQYLPSLYINYLAINKDLAKLLPQLY